MCDIDHNFTCYTQCPEYDQWDYDCKICHERCWSCFGTTKFHCFSCDELLFNYHIKGTTCPEKCGDGKWLGELECDDGNQNSGDGCSNVCHLEAGFKCLGGSPTSNHGCNEICGDGRKFILPCDDADNDDGDGCTSTCQLEPGWICYFGNTTNLDTCVEICGDGWNLGYYQCDDGNVLDGDGCSSICRIEKGWTCAGGTVATPDVCAEICGDGYNRFRFDCDDGNLLNGDGCDSTCNYELGWTCDLASPSFCWKLSRPKIVDHYVNSTHFVAIFNETIYLSRKSI